MQLSQKQKAFFQFFVLFLKSASTLEQFHNNMTLIAYVFPKLRTAKDVVR